MTWTRLGGWSRSLTWPLAPCWKGPSIRAASSPSSHLVRLATSAHRSQIACGLAVVVRDTVRTWVVLEVPIAASPAANVAAPSPTPRTILAPRLMRAASASGPIPPAALRTEHVGQVLLAGLLGRLEPRVVWVHPARVPQLGSVRGDLRVGQVDAVLAHAPGELHQLLLLLGVGLPGQAAVGQVLLAGLLRRPQL